MLNNKRIQVLYDYLLGKDMDTIKKKYKVSADKIKLIVNRFDKLIQKHYRLDDISFIDYIRKEYESLKQKNKEFKAAIDSSYDGIWITDGKGNTLFINKAIERITGLSAKNVIGKNMAELVEKGIFDVSSTLEAIKKRETITVMQKVITGIETIVTGNLSFDEEGNIFRVISNVRDITELNSLKEQMKKIEKENQRYHFELNNLKLKLEEHNKLIYKSKEMHDIIDISLRLAKFDSTVLITGETGVGKEIIAELIHESSPRKETGSFIRVNCTALPNNLLESELFGYEGGAFTGADPKGKPGLFELANNGTIFLDEIGELPLHTQVKFLRVLQEDRILRIGGTKPIPINTRIIVATNRNLKEMVKKGTFREDLYYRLNVVPIKVPPLRFRKDDIPNLITHFLEIFNKRYKLSKYISTDAMKLLINYEWPGNVRELKNIVERMMVITDQSKISMNDLPDHIATNKLVSKGSSLKEILETTEKKIILNALKHHNNTYKAAEALGISQSTMSRKARKYGNNSIKK